MPRSSCLVGAFIPVVEERILDLFSKIYNCFITALSYDPDSSVFEIYIIQIQPYAFRNTDSRTKQKSKKCQIPCFGNSVIPFFCLGQFFPVFNQL